MKAAPSPPRPNQKVDWSEAEAIYLALEPPRSFKAVRRILAERGVEISDTRISQMARRGEWLEKGAEVDRLAAEGSIRLAVRTREQRIRKTLGIVDRLLDRYETGVDRLELKPSDLPNLVKLAELLVGEPTDRVEVSAVRRVFALLVERAGRYVITEQREDFLAEMRELEASLPEPQEQAALDSGREEVVESGA